MRPLIVTVIPELLGPLRGRPDDTAGESKENIPTRVPTTDVTVSVPATLAPEWDPPGLHCTVEPDVQLVVEHGSSPRPAVAVPE